MKKVLAFLVICLFALGAVGGIGYAIYGGGYPIAVGVGALAVMAYEKAEKYWKILSD